MSIALPFLAVLIAGMFAAYHRLRLAVWAAISATLLVACWLLGAHPMATIIAGVLVALIALPLLVPQLRKPLITAPFICSAAVLWKSRSALISPACTMYLNTRVLLPEPLT